MFCTSCGAGMTGDAKVCSQCGKSASGATPATSSPATSEASAAALMAGMKSKGGLGSFLNFETMITPSIMKIYYIVGSAIIAIGALIGAAVFFFSMIAQMGVPGFFLGILMSILTIVGGIVYLVVFRIFCEVLILFFSMHKELKDINRKTGI